MIQSRMHLVVACTMAAMTSARSVCSLDLRRDGLGRPLLYLLDIGPVLSLVPTLIGPLAGRADNRASVAAPGYWEKNTSVQAGNGFSGAFLVPGPAPLRLDREMRSGEGCHAA